MWERLNFFASWLDEIKLSQGIIDTVHNFQRMREGGKIICMLIFGFNQFIMVCCCCMYGMTYTQYVWLMCVPIWSVIGYNIQ